MEPEPLVDTVTLGRAASSTSVGFDEFYLSEMGRLVALARSLAGVAVAEDIAQEAMLVAYRRWREVGALQRPDLWVRRTCANMAVSQFRRRVAELRATTRLTRRRPDATPEPMSERAEEFWDAVRTLPHRQAQAAALRFVYDMPIAEIAETLGCSAGTVKQHLSRARQALSVALDLQDRSD
ncbi:MAG: sigma-70 family RNA polymerase sigma factor [Nocardioides sp.]|uniref:RNA polymerase sigma factor n=1 Tax=Nocardioides sp. TaxID=35761 RepID=UPI00326585EE